MERERHEFSILAPDVVEKVTGTGAGEVELYLSRETLFPPGYMEYLIEVLKVNQHLVAALGVNQVPEEWLSVLAEETDKKKEEAKIWRLANLQLERLWNKNGNTAKVLEVRRDREIIGVVMRRCD